MSSAPSIADSEFREPVQLMGRKFQQNKWAYYKWMLEERPICRSKISVMNLLYFARYEDCVALSKDPRFVRDRRNAGGKRQLPVPLPKYMAALTGSMIYEDGERHRRLRNLVNHGFRPNAIAKLSDRIESLTHELLDVAEKKNQINLREAYAHPIPVTVIGEVVGTNPSEMDGLARSVRVLTEGLSGWSMARTLLWDLKGVGSFIRNVIKRKKQEPGDDILTDLIFAEDQGDPLTEDELMAMVFLLIIAGHETTVHLINNGVLTLFEHPEQLERLRAEPELIDSTVEEMLRFCSPVHGSKPAVATEDISWNGFAIKKGTNVMPNWASANRDPRVFDDPDVFDIGRSPNNHLAFAHGTHFCLGAQLARLETKIAIRNLVVRYPNLKLAVAPREIETVNMPGWHRHKDYPVTLR